MKKIGKKRADALDALKEAFTEAWDALDAMVCSFNDAEVGQARDGVRQELDAAFAEYVRVFTALRGLCREVRDAMAAHVEKMDGRTEGWSERPAGERFAEWKAQWDEVANAEEPELAFPEGEAELPADVSADVDMLASALEDA